jgi:hypothetical protein
MVTTQNDSAHDLLIHNPAPFGWPWTSPDGVTDDPQARVKQLPCGCYSRVDDQKILCAQHLDALNNRCSFQPENWGSAVGARGLYSCATPTISPEKSVCTASLPAKPWVPAQQAHTASRDRA